MRSAADLYYRSSISSPLSQSRCGLEVSETSGRRSWSCHSRSSRWGRRQRGLSVVTLVLRPCLVIIASTASFFRYTFIHWMPSVLSFRRGVLLGGRWEGCSRRSLSNLFLHSHHQVFIQATFRLFIFLISIFSRIGPSVNMPALHRNHNLISSRTAEARRHRQRFYFIWSKLSAFLDSTNICNVISFASPNLQAIHWKGALIVFTYSYRLSYVDSCSIISSILHIVSSILLIVVSIFCIAHHAISLPIIFLFCVYSFILFLDSLY